MRAGAAGGLTAVALALGATALAAGGEAPSVAGADAGCVTFDEVKPTLQAYRRWNHDSFFSAAPDAGIDPEKREFLPVVTRALPGQLVAPGAVRVQNGQRVIGGQLMGSSPSSQRTRDLFFRDTQGRIRLVVLSQPEREIANPAKLTFCGCFASCKPQNFVEQWWIPPEAFTEGAFACGYRGAEPPSMSQWLYALPRGARVGPPVEVQYRARLLRAADTGTGKCSMPP